MAPTDRTSLSNASKKLRSIMSSPANFIRKKLRRSATPVLRRTMSTRASSASLTCLHNVDGIRSNSESPNARALYDLFMESAISYSDSVIEFAEVLNKQLSDVGKMWTGGWEAMSRGGSLTRSDRERLRKFHERALTRIRQIVSDVLASLWTMPAQAHECRYHQDLEEIFDNLGRTQKQVQKLIVMILLYLSKCRSPTQMYGVSCRLEVRMRLCHADINYDQNVTQLRNTCHHFEENLDRYFVYVQRSQDDIKKCMSHLEQDFTQSLHTSGDKT